MADYLTLEEAAERLGVEYKTVYRLVRQGELAAGRVGRLYRIREDDLEAYFERQKRLVESRSRRDGAVGTATAAIGFECAACGQRMFSELSVGGLCVDTGRPICQACWSVRKVRRISAAPAPVTAPANASASAAGVEAGDGSTTTSPAAQRDGDGRGRDPIENAEPPSPAEIVEQLRAQGRPAVTAEDAQLACRRFLRGFGQRLEQIDSLPDPLSGQVLELRRARVRHHLEHAGEGDEAGWNQVSRFDLRTGGWGKPKAGLVLEARTLCDAQALTMRGYADAAIDQGPLFDALEAIASAAAKRDCFFAVLIGSPTGFTDAAVEMVTGKGEHPFSDRRVVVGIEDLLTGRTWLDERDERARPFWKLLAPQRYDRAVAECIQRVRELMGRRSSLSLADAVQRFTADGEQMRDAFKSIGQEDGMRVDEIDGIGPVLSRM